MARGSEEIRRAFGYLHEGELPALKEVIASLPLNSVCINIGAGSGTSGLAFMESQNVSALYTIDLYKATRPEGALGNEYKAMKDSGYGDDLRYHQIQGDSTVIGLTWDKGLVDMVFIDGDHSYEHCKSDILAWLPYIKTGGVMAAHDYRAYVWPGVQKAVNEILNSRFKLLKLVDTFIAFKIE